MQSKLDLAAALFRRDAALLRCPLCAGRLKPGRLQSLYCKKGHSFDLSKKGYVNFALAAPSTEYDRQLFASRGRILAQGCYDPLVSLLCQLAAARTAKKSDVALLDAGCGEGFYLARLAQSGQLPTGSRFFGVDLARDGVAAATGHAAPDGLGWCVADLAHLPFADGVFDVVLDLLTPASYAEFHRVLKPDGLLLKVVPGDDYLCEIRALLSPQLAHKAYSNQNVLDYADQRMHIASTTPLRYTLPLTQPQAADFLRMTPMSAKTALPDPAALPAVTIDLVVLAGRPKPPGKKAKAKKK